MPTGHFIRTDTHKRNISKSLSGKVKSVTHRANLSRANKGKVPSEESRKKMSESRRGKKHSEEWKANIKKGLIGKLGLKGDKHPNWKGGITPINKQIRQSLEYKLWRVSVFQRDKWKCVWCGAGGDIQADHIKPFAYYPELRFAIDNGRTLCVKCHRTTFCKYERKNQSNN